MKRQSLLGTWVSTKKRRAGLPRTTLQLLKSGAGFTPFEVERERMGLKTHQEMALEMKKRLLPLLLRSRLQTGFTLLEMIISIGVFLVAITLVLGALVSVNNAGRKVRSERVVADNVSAVIDSMSRTMRMGSNFHCGCGGAGDPTFPLGLRGCAMTDDLGSGGDVCIAFEGQQGDSNNADDQIVYRLSGKSIERSLDSGTSYLSLTAPELDVSGLKFYLYGIAPSDDQPVVTMLVRGSASTSPRTATKFDLQTTVGAYTPILSATP